MADLNDFFRPEVAFEQVIGTYIYPYCLLSMPEWGNPLSATEVIQRVDIDGEEILVARNGGLFIKPPEESLDVKNSEAEQDASLDGKLAYEEQAAKVFNLVICEYALHGIISEPATPIHISAGKLIDDHALVVSAGGGREIYLERTINPSMHLIQNTWRMHRVCDPQITLNVAKLSCASKLAEISENVPSLTAGAYSLFSRRQLSEALVDAWIVIEQIVDWLWDEYKNRLPEADRKSRLGDSRTYTSAVRIEILHTIEVFGSDLYRELTRARMHRNKLAHRAGINFEMASETLTAMKNTIEFLCDTTISMPSASTSINW